MPRAALPLLLLLLAGCRAHGAGPPWADCAEANRQAAADTHQALAAGLQRHVLNPVVVARLQSFEAQWAKTREAVARNPRTLAECEQVKRTLVAERTRLDAITGPPPAAGRAASDPLPVASGLPQTPAECRAQQARTYNELAQAYGRATSGRVPDNWAQPLQSLSERLTRLHGLITNPNAAGWDCAQVNQGLAQARADLDKLLR